MLDKQYLVLILHFLNFTKFSQQQTPYHLHWVASVWTGNQRYHLWSFSCKHRVPHPLFALNPGSGLRSPYWCCSLCGRSLPHIWLFQGFCWNSDRFSKQWPNQPGYLCLLNFPWTYNHNAENLYWATHPAAPKLNQIKQFFHWNKYPNCTHQLNGELPSGQVMVNGSPRKLFISSRRGISSSPRDNVISNKTAK